MSDALVIFCHPHPESHNRRILEAVLAGIADAGLTPHVIDLYGSGFPALLDAADYESMVMKRDAQPVPEVDDARRRLIEASNLVFIYPVWWYGMPAAMKGFIDRVFAPGVAYRFYPVPKALLYLGTVLSFIPGLRYLMQPHAATGLLKDKRAYIFRSFGGPAMGKRVFGNMTAGLENDVLRFCGITQITVHELYNVHKSAYSEAYEAKYLARARAIAASMKAGPNRGRREDEG